MSTIPVTMDVNSLYTNIPQEEGLRAFEESALNNPNLRPNPQLPPTILMTLLMFVLSFNTFVFNGNLFLQLWGTAMGTRVAPTYACIFMGALENPLLAAWGGTKLRMYRRYIDDCLFLVVWYRG